MIVRSLSRKAPTFSQLADYIGQDNAGGQARCFSRNLYYDGTDRKTIAGLFWDNYQHLPDRKNGNALYHEIIVLEPQPHLTRGRQVDVLHDLAQKYVEDRAPYHLVWGRTHFDTEFPHIHLMISANEIGSNRRKRLDRNSFANIQKSLERYKEHKWPDLEGQSIYNKSQNPAVKVKASEGELVRRTGNPSNKMSLAKTLSQLFAQSGDLTALKSALSSEGLRLYQRGQNWGVENKRTGKRYRLKTLGLSDQFLEILKPARSNQEAEQGNTPDLAVDERAASLLAKRYQIERHAQEQLIGPDHKDNEERDR